MPPNAGEVAAERTEEQTTAAPEPQASTPPHSRGSSAKSSVVSLDLGHNLLEDSTTESGDAWTESTPSGRMRGGVARLHSRVMSLEEGPELEESLTDDGSDYDAAVAFDTGSLTGRGTEHPSLHLSHGQAHSGVIFLPPVAPQQSGDVPGLSLSTEEALETLTMERSEWSPQLEAVQVVATVEVSDPLCTREDPQSGAASPTRAAHGRPRAKSDGPQRGILKMSSASQQSLEVSRHPARPRVLPATPSNRDSLVFIYLYIFGL